MLAAGWPMWLTGLPTRMGFPLDRYSLAFSVGVCILLAGLVDLLGGRTQSTNSLLRKAALISIAVGLAAGFHDSTALLYREDWQTVRDFFWQLTWRAPSVQPNTLFASNQMPFKFFEDDSLTAPLNWTFDPAGKSTQMPYMLYDLLTRHKSMPALIPNQKIWRGFRAAQFDGSTSQMVVFSYAPPGCVRILDPVYDAEEYNLSNQILQALPVSNPGLIQDSKTPAVPPETFGKEPKHQWCYYFEKAELARQSKNWGAIIALSNQSIHKGYRPKDPIEYLPFIEAYAQVRSLDDAFQLTESAYADSIAVRPALCAAWQRANLNLGGISETYKDRLKSTLSCSIP
jgi:hypothetical protein